MFRNFVKVFAVLVLLPVLVLAQDGKLRGKVTDKESGEPLIGANILVEGTSHGASTDVNGEYVILSVPAGNYTVKASYVGYAATTINNVRVNSNITTTQDFTLSSTSVQTKEVVITAERPLIQRNTTNTVRMTTQEDIKNLPLRGLASILSLNAGVVRQDGNLYVRGGRLGEVAFFVDGASATNPFFAGDNREAVSIIQEAIEDVQLQTGGYTAEFGGANSGIARTTTRTGGSTYKFSVDYLTDDFAKPGKTFLGTSAFGYRNVVATASGPIVAGATFFVAAQSNYLRDRNRMFLEPFSFKGLTTDEFYASGNKADTIGTFAETFDKTN
ncbi:MAG: TonB-dependent receptor, partial [Ignavibacteriales bacterium]|nr:TonB-dependent receptor [Ignavibacteriales bacterium]